MVCKIIWTEPSIDDLREIVAYIAAENRDSAQKVGNDIIRTVELLHDFPLLGPAYPPGSSGAIREIISWKYRIFYRVKTEERLIEILRIWHGARGRPPV